jgi:hypothetical protein
MAMWVGDWQALAGYNVGMWGEENRRRSSEIKFKTKFDKVHTQLEQYTTVPHLHQP